MSGYNLNLMATASVENRRKSLVEPVYLLRRVPIRECGEPLINFLEFCAELVLDKPRFRYRRETLLRQSVTERLCQAAEWLLPQGYRLAIVEGWRPQHIQKRMQHAARLRLREQYPDWSEAKLQRMVNKLTAPLDSSVPPPHSTGGAVDLLLANLDGKPLDHTSPYHPFDPAMFAFDAPGLSDTAREHRDLLAESLTRVGITNYPSEYWHWSYGDQGWAYRGDHPHAIYGAVQPENWSPDPADVNDEPLEWVE